jgi:hypothetical protein
MPAVPASALSIAADGVARAIERHFRLNGAQLRVTTDTPVAAAKLTEGARHIVNLFFYRVAPSGFHATSGPGDPLALRTYCLVTPFTSDDGGEMQVTRGEHDLRLLGEVLRLFHETPVIGPFASGAGHAAAYALQAVLHPGDMEEINHIWTALNGDTSYRPSAVYEFSLIPVDPAVARTPAPPAYGFSVDVDPHLRRREEGLATDALTSWSPALMAVDPDTGGLRDRLTGAAGAAAGLVRAVLAGPDGHHARLVWQQRVPDGWQPVDAPAPVDLAMPARRLDRANAVQVDAPAGEAGDLFQLRAWPLEAAAGRPLAGAQPSNAVDYRIVEAGP